MLETKCRLVTMPETTRRRVEPEYAINPDEDHVSFADAYPFLLISEGSLAEVNSRLETPVPMNRFRPNLVVSDTDAFAEDGWRKIRIARGFHLSNPAAAHARQPSTSDRCEGGHGPLRTLASFRTEMERFCWTEPDRRESFG